MGGGMRSRLSAASRRLQGRSREESDQLRLAVGSLHAALNRGRTFTDLRDAEFSVYSQWGEDGIIQAIVDAIDVPVDAFVEIGVQDYRECNTRFLLCADNWRGVIIDDGTAHAETLERDGLRWRYSIDAVSAWVTRDNVVELMARAGMAGPIGLLSVDIDGCDYWVLEAALAGVQPAIVITEYNSAFGPDRAVTIPYEQRFDRAQAHPSLQYFGASLGAFDLLLRPLGYRLVASNRAGNNAFFVRADLAGQLPTPSVAEAWVRSRYRESRDAEGRPTYLDPHEEGRRAVAELPILDLESGQTVTVGSLG